MTICARVSVRLRKSEKVEEDEKTKKTKRRKDEKDEKTEKQKKTKRRKTKRKEARRKDEREKRRKTEKKEDDKKKGEDIKNPRDTSVQLQGGVAIPEIHWQDCECVGNANIEKTVTIQRE
ncbi:PREDICTED: protein PXR1-like [Acromyrmex echinatior]|uniref:protein PXR1-like n=1 Tax=Acromyrmex echinatior TaxID=103372 RepID=UPI000580F7C9|nr:PREDICTED: protein PXR1-like [Acromyrmex echinatior]